MSAERLYLLDVEGTIAPLSLTSEQLFPYARKHFAEFLHRHIGDSSVRADLALLLEENNAEIEASAPRIPNASAPNSQELLLIPDFEVRSLAYFLWLMDRDRKSTALKSLQGKIWKAGFESGELKGTLFPDVPGAFERWSARGKVAIYSSGSVEAQKLLFRHTIYGDLSRLVSACFDTRTGPKMAPASYAAIAAAMDVNPADAVFFSDVVKELDAAREAGLQTRLVVREGNAPVDDAHGHESLVSLDGV